MPTPPTPLFADNSTRIATTSNMRRQLPINPLDPPYDCVGNGVTDDTACMQAALTASINGRLYLDGTHTFLVTSDLSVSLEATQTITVEGIGSGLVYSASCPSGFKTNSDINLLTITGGTPTVRNVGFQMAASAGTRRSGAALRIGSRPRVNQGHGLIEHNCVINAYDGIMVGALVSGASQSNGNIVANNLVVSPSHLGIANGKNSTGNSTVGTEFIGNQIGCLAANSSATGVAFYDGAVVYDGKDGGPYGCNIGMLIYPGPGQEVIGSFKGVLGDSSITNALRIDSNGGSALYLRFNNWWTGSANTATGPVNLIRNTSGAANGVRNIQFVGGLSHGCNAGTGVPVFDLENDVNDILIEGGHISPDCNQTTDTGILVNSSGNGGTTKLTVSGVHFTPGEQGGSFAKGINITGTGDAINITNNYFGEGVTSVDDNSIVWTTGVATRAVIRGNLTLANIQPTVSSAAAITAPMAETFILSGAAQVKTMAGMWGNRQVTIIPSGAVQFATGGGTGKFCNAVTATAQVPVIATWSIPGVCWNLK